MTTLRNPATQRRLNELMRRPDALQYLLFQSLNSEPATPEQVKEFLATAPPEVSIAVDGLLPVTADGTRIGPAYDDRIVQGFVGWVLENVRGAR